jgi:hypothetical protein
VRGPGRIELDLRRNRHASGQGAALGTTDHDPSALDRRLREVNLAFFLPVLAALAFVLAAFPFMLTPGSALAVRGASRDDQQRADQSLHRWLPAAWASSCHKSIPTTRSSAARATK